jgi:protein-S-isoprenylcysteine O-methyltransferase Ste14
MHRLRPLVARRVLDQIAVRLADRLLDRVPCLASLLSWTATRALGRHLRFDAALTPDHQLVRSGPYRLLRHPIYTSMFCLLLGTGFVITPRKRYVGSAEVRFSLM